LPIIQKLIVAYKLWREYFLKLNKIDRFSIGLEINRLFIEILQQLFTAIHKNRGQKYIYLARASETLDLLKFMLQISWEVGALELKRYIALSEPLHEIGKMLGGWLRQTKTRFSGS